MESRMEKYHEIDIEQFQRSKKNADLYKKVYGNYDDFENLPIPENTNEIDLENLKTLMENRKMSINEQVENVEISDDEIIDLPKSEKVYDINTLLEKAKEENAKIKKEVTVSRNVPNYLANLESDKNTKDIILKYDRDNDDDMPIVKETQYLTLEMGIEDKNVNTTSLSLDILSDLKPTGDTMVSEPVVDNTEKIEDEKDFFDEKSKFLKEDFDDLEDYEEEEEIFYEEKDYTFLKVLLIVIGLTIVFTVGYFVIKEYTNIF